MIFLLIKSLKVQILPQKTHEVAYMKNYMNLQ